MRSLDDVVANEPVAGMDVTVLITDESAIYVTRALSLISKSAYEDTN